MSFIHFGCWNRGKCDLVNPNSSNMSRVMSKLHGNLTKRKIEFIVVAGDNYYPNRQGIRFENFISGFECLPSDLLTFVLLGNHDVENIQKIRGISKLNNRNFIEKIPIESVDQLKIFAGQDCFIYKFQKWYSQYVNPYIYFVAKNVETLRINNTQIIMIDSNLCYIYFNLLAKQNNTSKETIKSRYKVDRYTHCYKKVINPNSNTNPNSNNLEYNIDFFERLVTEQNNSVHKIIRGTDAENIIIIGHHPIASHSISYTKDEPDQRNNKFEKNPKILDLFLQNSKKYYYLCADTHLYQHGCIKYRGMDIEQHICGTGGAKKDESPNQSEYARHSFSHNIGNSQHEVVYKVNYSETVNGYLYVDCNNDTPTFEFVHA